MCEYCWILLSDLTGYWLGLIITWDIHVDKASEYIFLSCLWQQLHAIFHRGYCLLGQFPCKELFITFHPLKDLCLTFCYQVRPRKMLRKLTLRKWKNWKKHVERFFFKGKKKGINSFEEFCNCLILYFGSVEEAPFLNAESWDKSTNSPKFLVWHQLSKMPIDGLVSSQHSWPWNSFADLRRN